MDAMIQSGVYAITHESGTAYIGSTVGLKRRLSQHRSDLRGDRHRNLHLQAAWNKYGESCFEFGVLEYLDDLDELHLAEQWWMDIYRIEGKELYNFGLAARNPMLGRPVSKETRRRISEALKGKPKSEEHCRKMSEVRMGKCPSKETRRKMSEALKGRAPWITGRKHTDETKRRMSETRGRSYPSFINRYTGEKIPAGINLQAMCLERGLDEEHMCAVKNGRRRSHQGWVLLSEHSQPWLL